MSRPRIAVVGAGLNSQRNHLPVLQKLAAEGLCELTVICDLNRDAAESAKSRFGFTEALSNAEAIFARTDIEAVYVIGTAQMHLEYAKKSLESRKHVFIEKPPTPTFEDSRALLSEAAKAGRIVAVGLNRFFYSSIHEARRLIAGTGKIVSIEGMYNKPFLNEAYLHGSSSWISYSAIHGISGVLAILDELPSELYSAVNKVSGEMPQNLSALLRWKTGEQATLSSNNTAGSRMEQYLIHAPGVSYACDERQLLMTGPGGEQELRLPDQDTRGFFDEHRTFLEAIRTGEEPLHGIRRATAVMYLVKLAETGFCGKIDWSVMDVPGGTSRPESTLRPERRKESILVLNPNTLKGSLGRIAASYRVMSKEELPGLSSAEKNSVVAAITGTGGGPVSDEMLERFPNIKVVGIVGASVKKYNPEGILKRNIPIQNASDVYARAVAEFNLLQALIGIKNASRSHDTMRAGGWAGPPRSFLKRSLELGRDAVRLPGLRLLKPLLRRVVRVKEAKGSSGMRGGVNLKGKSVGLVGYGAIAREFISLLRPFSCTVKVFSEYLTEEDAKLLGVSRASIAEALNCDIVSLHRGLSDRTRGSFGRHEIGLLRPGSVLINAARGELIDEEALLERLSQGDIFACLDVFQKEPLPPHHPLRKLPNVFLTAHIGGVTKETFSVSPEFVTESVLAYLRGEETHAPITRERLGSMS